MNNSLDGRPSGKVGSHYESWQEENKACQGEIGACLEKREANPKKEHTIPERRDVPNKEAIVEAVGALEDKFGDQKYWPLLDILSR
jgi:hypothetical protein